MSKWPVNMEGKSEINEAKYQKQLEEYLYKPYLFVTDFLGIPPEYNPEIKQGVQKWQKKALQELGKLIECKHWMHICGVDKVPLRLKGYIKKKGISIMACSGAGKDAFGAWVKAWYLLVWHKYSPKIICSAPSERQLRIITWSEFKKFVFRVNDNGTPATLVHNLFEVQSERIIVAGLQKEKQKTSGFIEQRVSQKDAGEEMQAATFSGIHEEALIFEFTEGDRIQEGIWAAADKTMTRPMNILLNYFNPTRTSGAAWRTHYDSKEMDYWIKIQLGAQDCEHIDQTQVERMIERYGRDSNFVRVFILGLPPVSETDAVFPFECLMEAKERDLPVDENFPKIAATDPAGDGRDATQTCIRQKWNILGFFETNRKKDDDIAEELLYLLKRENVYMSVILKNAVGMGTHKQVKKFFPRVLGVTEQEAARKSEVYANKRAEMHDTFRDALMNGWVSFKYLPEKERDQLIQELSVIKWVPDKPRKQIEDKKNIKRKLNGKSPDYADSCIATYCRGVDYFMSGDKGDAKYDGDLRMKRMNYGEGRGWLLA